MTTQRLRCSQHWKAARIPSPAQASSMARAMISPSSGTLPLPMLAPLTSLVEHPNTIRLPAGRFPAAFSSFTQAESTCRASASS